MLRLLLVAALAAVASAGLEGHVQNKFIVTYNAVPDFFNLYAFYTMPRTVKEATRDHFAQAAERSADNTTIWCRKNDHRVCVLFDLQGSVAGIQVSVETKELDNSGIPLDVPAIPEWREDTLLGKQVYAVTTFFVPKSTLLDGGRELNSETLTAPEGIYILQTDANGVETGRLHVSTEQEDALSAGFHDQSCFFGMGKHYFQGLTKNSTCEKHRPFFALYGPKTNKMNGFGIAQFGKPTSGRGWFEHPPEFAVKAIAPNSPACLTEWLKEYGLFTMHVFFIARPYLTTC